MFSFEFWGWPQRFNPYDDDGREFDEPVPWWLI